MTDRSLWFESHLFADRAGRKARDASERLGPQVHEQILVAGDRLAAASPAVAQQFYRHAAAVWQTIGPDVFDRCLAFGEDLLGNEPSHRDAALAYFLVTPKSVARVGTAHLSAWCATGKRVATVSRKLSAAFFQGTAPLIDTLSPEALAEWARHGTRLHGVAGWRGEFLAYAYFSAATDALPVLCAEEFGAWADLGAALQPVLRETQYFTKLPSGLAAFKPPERAAFFAAALIVARTNLAAAAAFYTQLPTAVHRLQGAARLKLLQIFERAAADVADALADIVPVVGALVRDIPREHRLAALELATTVADAFPRGSVALLRSLPTAYEDARHPAVEQWVRRGIEVATENVDAGIAYFALESRTSVKVLQAASTAAVLNDVQGLLRKYMQMLSGRTAAIRGADNFGLRPALEQFPLEDEVELPLKVDLFA
ncbi:MAG: hypothetical protein ACRDL7_04310, partial [Gaiellaceae bacterium]